MSYVTNVVILVPLGLESELARVNALISEATGEAVLKRVADHAGGTKCMEHCLWAAAFIGLDRAGFLAAMNAWLRLLDAAANAGPGEARRREARWTAEDLLMGLDLLIVGQQDRSASLFRFDRATREISLRHAGEPE